MRNASRATPIATSVAHQQQQQQQLQRGKDLQQQQQQLQQQQHLQQDHIITISTASLTEHAQVPLKQHTTTTTATTAAAATTPPTTTAPVAVAGNAAAATGGAAAAAGAYPAQTRQPFKLCGFSQLISYQNNIADVQHRRGRRLHGLQLPLHPLQLFGWLVLLLFGLASYWVLIPAFQAPIQGPLYGLISGLYVVHIAAHLTALLTDPADKELRRVHRNDRIVPEFDRNKHGHVIENGRCHLCNIRTSTPRTKHCSVCNKCVGKFDHHCKWLNHCIGSRNYVAFLMCVVSAVVATLVIVAAVIGQIVLYYLQPDWLSFYWCGSHTGEANLGESTDYINLTLSLSSNNSMLLLAEQDSELETEQQHLLLDTSNMTVSTMPTLLQNFTALLEQSTPVPLQNHTITPLLAGISLHESIYLLLLGVLGLLAAISAGLLLHLCFFHIYISFLGLTTYEYIRNHRQAQEAKAKQLLEAGRTQGVTFKKQSPTSSQSNPSKQLYCCSSLPHPNQQQHQNFPAEREAAHSRLHCCSNSRELQPASRQSIYVCSLLEEQRQQRLELQLERDEDASTTPLRAFHCCSSYAASALQRRLSVSANAKTALEPRQQRGTRGIPPGSASYLQYTEQCTMCTFQLRSPLRGSSSSAAGSSSTRTLATPSSSGSHVSKQRWRRKWNCCASVPDSPDVPQDLLAKLNATELPVQFIRSLDLPHATELPLKTPRSSSRLRHMLRLLGRYRRARCQRGGQQGVAAAEQHVTTIKQNQIRPLQLGGGRGGYENGSSGTTPMPQSSPSNSACSDASIASIASSLSLDPGKELVLLPTSIIRDDSVTTSYSLTLPPALPPPTRRKMPNASELAELAETLGFVTSQQTQPSNCSSSSNSRHLPPGLSNVYRRQRRKHFLRTRSPTLSPIHESGLSNPTSPQPLRHSLANSSGSLAKCSPDVARSSATLVQNLCGLAGEALRKTASNSSLQSISSNSSST